MLEKVGLPAKPSLRGNNWVVDASHCQGCSSQFTFINRKHHCRRCGGLFCGGCTQQRMVLRGQGDSPVRICEPCKKLEEAARFELRYGNKYRAAAAARGSSRFAVKNEDGILNQILANDVMSGVQRSSSSSASCSAAQEVSVLDSGDELHRSRSAVDETNLVQNETGSSISPEELRKQAADEKQRYKVLKGQGKSVEAMKAFKRGKELERQADALEISIRKNRKKGFSSGNMADAQDKDGFKESGRKTKVLAQVGKEKDDFNAELRELGWTDVDPHDEDKRSTAMSLEGELSSLLGDTSQRTNKGVVKSGIDNTQVIAHKRKALALKREGKLGEAKEELKKAKVLEKQLEEQELLGGADDFDDEISALIRSMDDDKQDELVGYAQDHGFDFDHLMGTVDDLGDNRNLDVTAEDLMDPEIAAALKSLGWTDDSDNQSVPIDREALLSEIHSLKREALNQKRAGNVAEAMAKLKKAKVLERDLGSLDSEDDNLTMQNAPVIQKVPVSQDIPEKKDAGSRLSPKNRLTVQKELLALKKKALTLRREGRLDEAEEELKKGKVLEHQLEEMDNASKAKAMQVTVDSNDLSLAHENSDLHGNFSTVEGEEDVTDQDMNDPAYLSLLRNLGWKEDEAASPPMKHTKENGNHFIKINEPLVSHAAGNISSRLSRRSKGDIQRELLALKRKAFALRREGKTDEAEEVLSSAKELEIQMAEMEASIQKEIQVESKRSKDDDDEFVSPPLKPSNEYDNHSLQTTESSITHTSSSISSMTLKKSKGEIQRELLGLKRKALALRREGKADEADDVLRSAKALETQMVEMEASKKEIQVESNRAKDEMSRASLARAAGEEDADDVTEKDMYDPALLSMLKNFEWKNEEFQPVAAEGKVPKNVFVSSVYSTNPFANSLSTSILYGTPSGKEEAQQDRMGGEAEPSDGTGSLENVGTKLGMDFVHPPCQPGNTMDLLTGDGRKCSQMPASKPESIVNSGFDISSLAEARVQVETLPSSPGNLRSKEDKVSVGPDASSWTQGHAHRESLTSSPENLGSKVNVTTEKREHIVAADVKPGTYETKPQGLPSQNNQSNIRQEVLARKKKAVSLKREGKLLEAREELRQAKLLEKSLDAETTEIEPSIHNVSTSVSTAPPVQQKEPDTSKLATKPLSGRDRFKLQQESLGHKRQALKLRREGRMEEAEAEFELAKALEVQLEEMASQSSGNSSVGIAEPVDDIVVEDLLDPQLLSALRAIGIEDVNTASKDPERSVPVKVNPGKEENNTHEKIQLEEKIKMEKVKAINLKRAGKQAEALEALRRAKLFEKKLSSLASN